MVGQGEVPLGKELFARLACVTCHAVDPEEVQKGPYLGSAGSKFTRDYLIESVLNPV
ncbi:MAG: c-type cytochrome, partial [Akkermansiaceae bacterium]|nr:c-type cytochrome [Akkermansiaceae bacterium]